MSRFVLLLVVSCVTADISERTRPRFSLKNGFESDDNGVTFPRGFQLPQEIIRHPFRPDPHGIPIYHRPTQAQVVDLEEVIPSNEAGGYNYPKPSRPFPPETDFRPVEHLTTTTRPELFPEDIDSSNFLHGQELNNAAQWRPEGFHVFEWPSPVASHHQTVVYYTLPKLTNVANFKEPTKNGHFIPKVFYLPPDYYHQQTKPF